MVRRVKAYLLNVNDIVIEDEKELQVLSEKCEPPPQPTQPLTTSSSMGNIQVNGDTNKKCKKYEKINKKNPSHDLVGNSSVFIYIFCYSSIAIRHNKYH